MNETTAVKSRASDDGPFSLQFVREGAQLTAAVKDNFAMAGLPTTLGSACFASGPSADGNAEVVDRLQDGGVAIVGRARMHELAYGVTGRNDWSGTPINPSWPDRIVGGSSSGCAAAVAAGLVDFAIGTDTGGSIRMPAACCGVVGLKPTFGLVSRAGVLPARSTLDCVGPIAATVAGVEQAMSLIADGFAPCELAERSKIAVINCEADDDVADVVRAALMNIVADTVDHSFVLFDRAFQAGLALIGAEMWAEFASLAPDFAGIGQDVADRLRRAAAIDAVQVADAEAVRLGFTAEVDAVFEWADFLVLPTLPAVPPLLADAEDPLAQLRLTRFARPFNVSGHPALTIPVLTARGLPAGIQIVGPKGRDAAVCAFGRQVEVQIIHWTERML